MSNPNPFAELFQQDSEDMDIKKKIVEQLLNNENLSTKTELNKPLKWSCLDSLRDFINKHKMVYSEGILKKFIETSFQFLISNERKGRTEYIEALKSLSNLNSDKQIIQNPLNPIK